MTRLNACFNYLKIGRIIIKNEKKTKDELIVENIQLHKKITELELDKSDFVQLIDVLEKRLYLFRETQKLAKIGGWQWDVEHKSMFWTDETYSIHGFEPSNFGEVPSEILNSSVKCFDKKDRPQIKKAFNECIAKGKAYDLEFPFTNVLGKRIWIRTVAKAERKENKIVSIIGNFIDITQRKESKLLLEESENKYRELFEKSKDAILIIEKGKFVDCNQATVDMLGYNNKHELLQTHPSELSPKNQPDGQPSNEKANKMMRIAIEKGSNRFEWDHVKANGDVFPVEVLLTPVTTEKGKKILHTVWRDITERKKAESAIKESEEKFRKLAELLPEIIYESDIYGNLTFVNKQAYDAFNYTEQDFNDGINFLEIVIPEERERCKESFRKVVIGEKVVSLEFTALRKNGSTFPILIYANPIFKNDKPVGIRGIVIDITARRKLEEQLRQSQKMEAVGQLAGGVAHDFNNLLTVINGYCDLIFMKNIPKELKRPLDLIKSAGEKASKLTAQLLAFSRKQVIKPKIMNLNLIIADQTKMLRRLLGENIEISVLLAPDLNNIQADSGQIEQIIMNLAINARDAMPLGGKLTIETANKEFDSHSNLDKQNVVIKPGKFVMLALSDNGVGMDENTKNRIFEPFFTTKGRDKGTGLGLSTVYGIVKQNGGFINVESRENVGTSFRVYLPMIEELLLDETTKNVNDIVTGGNETILLVEDDPGVREVTHTTLATYGYKIITASNGEEALRIYSENKLEIDLLLTDVIMPLMGGRELVENLLKIAPELKVIFFSGYTDNNIEHHGILKEGIEFLQKPYSHIDLTKKVRFVLDR